MDGSNATEIPSQASLIEVRVLSLLKACCPRRLQTSASLGIDHFVVVAGHPILGFIRKDEAGKRTAMSVFAPTVRRCLKVWRLATPAQINGASILGICAGVQPPIMVRIAHCTEPSVVALNSGSLN